jgi:hypothetical protein
LAALCVHPFHAHDRDEIDSMGYDEVSAERSHACIPQRFLMRSIHDVHRDETLNRHASLGQA